MGKIHIITPNGHNTVYGVIWNRKRDGKGRFVEPNKCFSCQHQIMLYEKDYKRIISNLSSYSVRVYYHGTECHVCGRICGEVLLADSLPRQEVTLA